MSEANFSALLKGAQGEYEEKKSRFLSQSFCVRREEEVAEILSGLRKQHYDARHVCYAYILHGNPPVEKSSDDGEPAKTAGLPMLDLLRAASLRNTLITVVRYFGGTKLGTGGLVRAYTAAAKEALNASVTAEILPAVQLSLCLDYGFTERYPPRGRLRRNGALPFNLRKRCPSVSSFGKRTVRAFSRRSPSSPAGLLPRRKQKRSLPWKRTANSVPCPYKRTKTFSLEHTVSRKM